MRGGARVGRSDAPRREQAMAPLGTLQMTKLSVLAISAAAILVDPGAANLRHRDKVGDVALGRDLPMIDNSR